MSKAFKATLAVAAATAAIAGTISTPSAVNAWGDNGGMRKSHTIDEINRGALGDKIVFNTISNSEMGDEKNFVGARVDTGVNAGAKNVWEGNEIKVEDGKTYLVRLYVHNNSPYGYDKVAKDTKVSFSIPGTSAKEVEVNGFITSSNATPSKYWDNVVFKSDKAFHLEYVYGSALLENNGIGKNGGIKLDNAVVSENGTLIGYDKLDGKIPGCYQYASFVTIKVKAVFDTAYTIENQVRRVGGDKTWGNSVDAKIGDKVEFRISYKNNSNVDQMNVGVKAILPKGLKYVAGSTKLVSAKYPNGGTVNDNNIVAQGINIGNYTAGSNAFVRFQAEVVDEGLANGKTALVTWTQGGVNKTAIQDYAQVVVTKNTGTPTTDTPIVDPTPTLPTTGPEAVAGGVIAAGSIVTAAGYYIASRRSLR